MQLKEASERLFGLRGAWAYEHWALLNQRFFADQLQPGPILWGMTAGAEFGAFNPLNNAIALHEGIAGIDFAEQARRLGQWDWVMADRSQQYESWGLPPASFGIGTALSVLLHQMMHQYHHQTGLSGGDHHDQDSPHHNPVWIAECRRLAPRIGLPKQIWPLYRRRKESIAEVELRLGEKARHLSSRQLANRRQWIWVATLDDEELDVDALEAIGQQVASATEVVRFPVVSYHRYGIRPPQRTQLMLGQADPWENDAATAT